MDNHKYELLAAIERELERELREERVSTGLCSHLYETLETWSNEAVPCLDPLELFPEWKNLPYERPLNAKDYSEGMWCGLKDSFPAGYWWPIVDIKARLTTVRTLMRECGT